MKIDWEKKIISDLGLKKYNNLFCKTDEEITISPFYYYDINKTSIINPDKLLFPNEWNIISEIDCSKQKKLQHKLDSLFKNEIKYITLKKFEKIKLNNLNLRGLNIYLKIIKNEDLKLSYKFKHKVTFEPKLNRPINLKINFVGNEFYNLNISSEFFKNIGSNIVQEIAFSLSAANEFVKKLGSEVLEKISFELVQGSNYFMEIAKIQALRILWSLISKKNGMQIDNCIITAKPTIKNKTIKDYNNNIVRSTSECMSAILGGCNFIKSMPYDVKFKEKNSFSDRIMNNQLLILKNEASIDNVSNAISGSYYITFLIEQLAQKSLDLFKKIENEGGYSNSIKKGGLINKVMVKCNNDY